MMNDQAARLRERLKSLKSQAKSVAVMSGKGGVGKSNFSLNFAIALGKAHKRVLLFDLDIGMGNIDILIGESSKYSIVDYFEQKIPLTDLITNDPKTDLDYISGGTGLGSIFKINDDQFQRFTAELEYLFKAYDYIIFDMGAGISEESLRFILSVDEIIVITTPEPTAMTDAYAAMKQVSIHDSTIPLTLVINRVYNRKIGEITFKRLSNTMINFMKREVTYLGTIPDDSTIMKAVINQQPFINFQPNCPASRAIVNISEEFINKSSMNETVEQSTTPFITKFKHFFMKGR
ncbi:MinD/ParA family protein [Metabacillus malikii]|uniref:Flagellar biosynthesis protein FlhG n=1 Tax=Metabacillus malikii TaxID=1504265 RepID=A0ABT9ZE24_9BACI|nr:MinD/ParA family protein [Metabacillus malikii]MDQ0230515.1 flagellar biosynthesis protein FlhG [Metabacillus malikii]